MPTNSFAFNRDLFRECFKIRDIGQRDSMNTLQISENRERMGLEPLVTTMARIGGWPMIMEPEEWDETEHSWQKVDDYYAILTGHNSLYSIEVYASPFENDTYTLVSIINISHYI